MPVTLNPLVSNQGAGCSSLLVPGTSVEHRAKLQIRLAALKVIGHVLISYLYCHALVIS
jgi:hypothetical protein